MQDRWKPNPADLKFMTAQINHEFKRGEKVYYRNPLDIKAGFTDPKKNSTPDPTFIANCGKVAAFLADDHAVTKQLIKLSKLLESKIQKNTGDAPVFILRKTLEEELSKIGFKPNFTKGLDVLTPEIFRAMIYNRLMLKDAVINPAHGEFTHAIQWLSVAWQQAEYQFLDMDVIDLYEKMGSEDAVFSRAIQFDTDSDGDDALDKTEADAKTTEAFIIQERSTWDLVVDRTDRTDFRSPEKLQEFMVENDMDELAVLRDLIKKRQEKRSNESEDQLSIKYEQKDSEPMKFFRKDNRGTYHRGELPEVLEPEDSQINMNEFRIKQQPK